MSPPDSKGKSTSNRSRQPSLLSRTTTSGHAPSSLRAPTIRKTSTHISLIFAEPDTAPSPSSSSETSEEALLRHLDGDGGRQIGLRSRRGSGATLQTLRTRQSSMGSQVAPISEEMGLPVAGPSRLGPDASTLPLTDDGRLHPFAAVAEGAAASPSREDSVERRKRVVNPKKSSSWLRWNSPAPSFPRSKSPSLTDKCRDRDKGKGRAGDSVEAVESLDDGRHLQNGIGVHEGGASEGKALAKAERTSDGESKEEKGLGNVERTSDTLLADSAPTLNRPIDPGKVSSSPSHRSWLTWGRSAQIPDTSIVPGTESADTVRDRPPINVDHSTAPHMPLDSNTKPVVQEEARVTADVVTDEQNHRPEPGRKKTVVPAPPSTGWMSYIWGSKRGALQTSGATEGASSEDAPKPVADGKAAVCSDAPMGAHKTETGHGRDVETPPDQIDQAVDKVQSATEDPPADDRPGWGSYFYPFVTPKPNPPRMAAPSHSTVQQDTADVTTSEPQQDARPLAVPTPNQPTPQPRPANPSDSIAPSSSDDPRTRQNSTASATGWLNFLAFRASQKKITNSSTFSIKSGRAQPGEEVMDFSNDPDFPIGPPSTTDKAKLGPKDSVKSKISRGNLKTEDPTGSLAPGKSTQPLPRPRKLSNTSTASSEKTAILPKAGQASKSSLPPPAAPPASQPNLVIPSFETTFNRPPRSLSPVHRSGITATTSRLAWRAVNVMGSYVYGDAIKDDPKETRGKHAGRGVGDDLPRRLGTDEGWRHVKRIAVVGVHGWFPAKMLNSVIGEPTGTSTKFANMMGQAVKQFFESKGVNSDDLRITLMPLEGEGTIDSRVERLYKAYLSNPAWINDLRRADAIFFAAHSQGCIVVTHLIARMIAQGHIRTPLNADAVSRCAWAFGPIGIVPDNSRRRAEGDDGAHQKVAMLAMCGVHLGPLYSISTSSVIQPYLQWFENAAARELFEFQDSGSAVSLAYQKALNMVLENGIKVVLLASLNDQVVPIYGASYSTATHPLLLRALFVDGASYSASDFMTNLLCFAFMLRNAGMDDQRLVEHLSEATAGSLTGLGHSSPYEELGCYSLAVDYLFLSAANHTSNNSLKLEPFSARETRNDYELPWIMRALVDSPEIKDLFPEELKELKEGVLAWKPTTKALKEIKRRLEPMAGRQSKLRIDSSTSTPEPGSPAMRHTVGPAGAQASGLKRDW